MPPGTCERTGDAVASSIDGEEGAAARVGSATMADGAGAGVTTGVGVGVAEPCPPSGAMSVCAAAAVMLCSKVGRVVLSNEGAEKDGTWAGGVDNSVAWRA